VSADEHEELLAVIEQHGRTTPGLMAPGAGDGARGAPRLEQVNPTCGDRVDLTLTVDDGRAVLRGTADGCTLSRAAASLLAATLHAMAPAEAAALLGVLVRARSSGRPLEHSALPGRIGSWTEGTAACAGAPSTPDTCAGPLLALAELAVAPLRRRCILLPWTTAQTLLEAALPEAATGAG
jgi:NifU-like protein involved in Fe-S cluster formation